MVRDVSGSGRGGVGVKRWLVCAGGLTRRCFHSDRGSEYMAVPFHACVTTLGLELLIVCDSAANSHWNALQLDYGVSRMHNDIDA